MEESQFFIPNLAQDADSQRIEPYLRNLQGVFSVIIDIENSLLQVRHIRSLKRRELSRSLNKIGFPERMMI